MDPPRHVRLRRLVNKGFTPRMVAQLEPEVRAIANRIIDDVAARGTCDFVTDVSALLPLAVICSMMGIPQEDWALMFDLTNGVHGTDELKRDAFVSLPVESRRDDALEGVSNRPVVEVTEGSKFVASVATQRWGKLADAFLRGVLAAGADSAQLDRHHG